MYGMARTERYVFTMSQIIKRHQVGYYIQYFFHVILDLIRVTAIGHLTLIITNKGKKKRNMKAIKFKINK